MQKGGTFARNTGGSLERNEVSNSHFMNESLKEILYFY